MELKDLKLSFERTERSSVKCVRLMCGTAEVTRRYSKGPAESSPESEAKEACDAELARWIEEERPRKPKPLTGAEALRVYDEACRLFVRPDVIMAKDCVVSVLHADRTRQAEIAEWEAENE